MRILVVGARGQVGRELVDEGNRLGLATVGLDVPELDITDARAVERCVGAMEIDAVVNAAAYTAVDAAETAAGIAFSVNRDGAAHLAEACEAKGIPLIHISTDYVYDGTKNGAYVETDPVSPKGVYAQSKAAGDAAVAEILPRHIILRTAWVYGVHGHNFVKTMLRLFRERRSVSVVADQYGSPTDAAAVAQAILRVVAWVGESPSTVWGTYHYTGKGRTSWYLFAKKVLELAGPLDDFILEELKPVSTADYPTPAQRPLNSVLDCSKFERTFGIPTVPWEQRLQIMLQRLYRQKRPTGSRT